MTRRTCLILALLAALLPGAAAAHEVRPAYLEMVEREADRFEVLLKLPARGDAMVRIDAVLPHNCTELTPRTETADTDARVARWSVQCPGGLGGGRIAIAGIEATFLDALVRIDDAEGRSQTVRLSSANPAFEVAAAPTAWGVAHTYFALGIEHILLGVDHLLFVATLLILANGWRRLLGLVTAFTVAHSITLAAAAVGGVSLAPGPIEALIALSIALTAAEGMRGSDIRASLIATAPWVVAFAFGLLHGFGFAGALAEVGLPQGAVPLGLLFFNLGVEVGQIAFVMVLIAVLWGFCWLYGARPDLWLRRGLGYAAGSLGAFWFIERTVGIVT
jgi:hypothetical protein